MLFIITPINSYWMFGAILHQHLFCLVSCSVEAIMIIFCLILVFMYIIIIVLNNDLHVFLFFTWSSKICIYMDIFNLYPFMVASGT